MAARLPPLPAPTAVALSAATSQPLASAAAPALSRGDLASAITVSGRLVGNCRLAPARATPRTMPSLPRPAPSAL